MNAQYKIQYAIQVDELVRMPESTAAIKHKFYEMSGFPNVVGAIDCTQVGINICHWSPNMYVNRKRQTIDNTRLFITIFLTDAVMI